MSYPPIVDAVYSVRVVDCCSLDRDFLLTLAAAGKGFGDECSDLNKEEALGSAKWLMSTSDQKTIAINPSSGWCALRSLILGRQHCRTAIKIT